MNLISLFKAMKLAKNNTKVLAALRTWMIEENFYQPGMLLEKIWSSNHPRAKRIYTRIVAATGGLDPETNHAIAQEVTRIAQELRIDISYNKKRHEDIREEVRLEFPKGPSQAYIRMVRKWPAH